VRAAGVERDRPIANAVINAFPSVLTKSCGCLCGSCVPSWGTEVQGHEVAC
jgi:hypothetical protein